MSAKLNKKDLLKIKLVVFDFDGVFTDDRVIVDEDGRESVICFRGDGIGLSNLRKRVKDILVLSTETNAVVKMRCAKLKVQCIQGCADKLEVLKKIVSQRRLKPIQVCYVGNDINDLDCLRYVGLPMIVANSCEDIKPYALYITQNRGSEGAVREVCDLICQAFKERSLKNS